MHPTNIIDAQRQTPLELRFQHLTSVDHIAFILLHGFGAIGTLLRLSEKFLSDSDNYGAFVKVLERLEGYWSV